MSKKFTLIPLVAALFSGSLFAAVEAVTIDDLPQLKQESQHGTASKRVASLFARSHYTPVRFNDELSSKVYDRYIESLDFNKSVFLASDIASFEQYRDDFDNAITTGKLEFTFDIFNLSLKRRFERYEYSLTLLEKEMTFDKEDEYFYDREDSRYKNAEKRLVQSNSEDAFQIVMNSLARSIEAHTSYLSPRRAEQFKMDMDLELEGIGAVLSPDEDYTVIRSLVPGGPADKTDQIKADDRIIGVAQDGEEFVDVIGWRLDDVVDLIKGPKGTKVRLQYLKGVDAHGAPKVVEITRDKIRLEDRAAKSEVFEAKYSDLTSKVGVIEIPGFYNNLSKDVKVELAKLKEEKVDGIIIDLRQNGGGSLYEATQLSGLFFDQGPVVQIHTLNNRIEEQKDRDGITYYDGPLTVLVDRYSASASEIFAAAMQDYGRAVIIGEQTFGKGTVQQHKGLGRAYDLYDNALGSVQYTIAKFYRINGGSTQHKGVIPDISFPSAIDPAEWGESKQDNALPWDSIVKAKYKKLGNLTPIITYLEKQHEVRIKSEPEFGYVFNDITLYNEEKDRKTISLVEATRIKEKDEGEARALVRTNERLKRLGKDPVENLDDLPEVIEELDPFLEEAALITQDYINYGRIAKK